MFVPDMAQLDGKSPEQIVEFWFNYWNDLYPIPDLKLAFETEGYIAPWSGYADSVNKKTAFNPKKIRQFIGYNTARHEHVHQLLSQHGYDNRHKLLFALVDNALDYAFDKARGHSKPENTICHYDVHEQVDFSHFITTRHFLVLSKRLSRHAGDIKTLIRTADRYADSLHWSGVVHPCIRIGQAHQIIGQQHNRIQQLECQLADQVAKLNSMKLKFSFGCLLTAAIFLLTKL